MFITFIFSVSPCITPAPDTLWDRSPQYTDSTESRRLPLISIQKAYPEGYWLPNPDCYHLTRSILYYPRSSEEFPLNSMVHTPLIAKRIAQRARRQMLNVLFECLFDAHTFFTLYYFYNYFLFYAMR